MGKLAKAFGKVGDRVFGTPDDRKRRAEIEKQIKIEEREAYNQSYKQARIATARKQGRAKGSKHGGSGLGELSRYAESFSKAGEDFMKLPEWGPRKRKGKRKRDNFDFF